MNRRIHPILFLLLLVTYTCRPVLPFIQYAVLKDYIAKNLCVNKDIPENTCEGKCYRDKQLEKSAETSDNEEKRSGKRIGVKEINEFFVFQYALSQLREMDMRYFVLPDSAYKYQYTTSVFVPPKA